MVYFEFNDGLIIREDQDLLVEKFEAYSKASFSDDSNAVQGLRSDEYTMTDIRKNAPIFFPSSFLRVILTHDLLIAFQVIKASKSE